MHSTRVLRGRVDILLQSTMYSQYAYQLEYAYYELVLEYSQLVLLQSTSQSMHTSQLVVCIHIIMSVHNIIHTMVAAYYLLCILARTRVCIILQSSYLYRYMMHACMQSIYLLEYARITDILLVLEYAYYYLIVRGVEVGLRPSYTTLQ